MEKIIKESENGIDLSLVKVELLIQYCRNNLNSVQKRQITMSKKNYGKCYVKEYYLFDIGGVLISKFKTIKEVAKHIGCHLQSVTAAYKRKNILYGIYWIQDTSDFKCEKSYYNKGNYVRTTKKH